MVSNKQHAADWKSQNAFTHFTELCSVHGHPALAHVPSKLPATTRFLQTSISRGVWDGSNLTRGVQELALKLDQDWPEWVANTTNVLGVILHDMFADADFFPSLESLPAHQPSITTCIRFEKLLCMEAQVRHKSKPATCFRPRAKVECAGHPINSNSRRMYSWRAYCEIVAQRGEGDMAARNMTLDDWVLV
ncbi:hypothetical protein FS749_016669 [Ceratobasidium sp. UAMH 11750]|nr:hypothetical protein FS749_016669 [Ceratobasidium sp. UAMH 11750]